MKTRGKVIFTALILLFVMGSALYGYMTGASGPQTRYKISVIVYGNNKDRWAFLREGVNQGALEFPAEVNFVTMSKEADTKEQIRMLQREADNGADGILLAAVDSEGMAEAVNAAGLQVPILMIETDAPRAEQKIGCLSADDYEMGRSLGERIRREHPGEKVAVIYEYMERDSVRLRCEGLLEGLGEDAQTVFWQRGEGDFSLSLFLGKMYRSEGAECVMAALDDVALEAAIDMSAKNRENASQSGPGTGGEAYEPPLIYGIGATDKIVYYLDKGYLEGIVFQNEFSIGYLGMERMNGYLEKRPETPQGGSVTIEYYEADQESMYEADLQRLLFPNVQ